jgi:putative membrane protein
MSAWFAFFHHVAAFTLVAALAVEFVLMREPLTLSSARRIRLADAIFGASAGLILIVGLLRVFLFEKGAAYYFNSGPFIAKLSGDVNTEMVSDEPASR